MLNKPCAVCNGRGELYTLPAKDDVDKSKVATMTPCYECRGSGMQKDRALRMGHEDQRSISDWATNTFGNSKDPKIVIKRMLKECYELQELLDKKNVTEEQFADELADIFICGYRAFDSLGFNAHACIDHKMGINRGRKWKLNGDGTAQHIKE